MRGARTHAHVLRALLLAAAVATIGGGHAAAAGHDVLCSRGRVAIVSVELALDDAARARGLMGRTELAPGHGMWFDFGRTAPVSMWMKDTLLALDMVFVDASGEVVDVTTGTTPNSTALITPPAPVRYVLELPAGDAARLGIATGARCALRADRARSAATSPAP